uniref:RGS domain-containing protein n=1 Tax=Ditylenchus dipsaci TaxID=166011 RepID=A0A915CVG6_9BILA
MFHYPQHPHLNTSERNWSERLENVLNDYDALNLFKSWMGVDEDSSEHPIRLHFAIIAYKDMVDKKDPRCLQLAKDIYNKFLRQKIGLCAFVEPPVRESIGRKMRQLGNGGKLAKQHALFVSSQEFLDFFNSSLTLQDIPEGGNGTGQHASTSKNVSGQRKSRRCHGEVGTGAAVPRLTATSLMRSQRDRETALDRAQSRKCSNQCSSTPTLAMRLPLRTIQLSPPHFPVMLMANKTTLATLFRMTREEHRRVNPVLANFPRPDPPAVSSANQFRHDIEEGEGNLQRC